jgi:hypothetical protein
VVPGQRCSWRCSSCYNIVCLCSGDKYTYLLQCDRIVVISSVPLRHILTSTCWAHCCSALTQGLQTTRASAAGPALRAVPVPSRSTHAGWHHQGIISFQTDTQTGTHPTWNFQVVEHAYGARSSTATTVQQSKFRGILLSTDRSNQHA